MLKEVNAKDSERTFALEKPLGDRDAGLRGWVMGHWGLPAPPGASRNSSVATTSTCHTYEDMLF